MDNLIGRPFGATGMRIVERSDAVEIYKGDGTIPLRANVQPVLGPLKIRPVPRERHLGQNFAPPREELVGTEEKSTGTTVIPPIKIRS